MGLAGGVVMRDWAVAMESDSENGIPTEVKPLEQLTQALLELNGDIKQWSGQVKEHARLLESIQRRQRAKTGRLDAHEKRIAALEAE
jgi:hypothetical protein